jgi:predicted DsbA family dithiol-disulfide isomerase
MAAVAIEQFTDPFSPWCWAAQPTLRRLRFEFDDVAWTPRMTLLVPPDADHREGGSDDEDTDDAMRRTRWAAAAAAGGLPVADGLLADELPSSLHACAAVAFVRDTAPERALAVLRRLRVAAVAEGRRLDDPEEVAPLAGEVEGVDAGAVRRGLEDGRAEEALADDLARAVAVAEELESVEVRGDLRLLPATERFGALRSGADDDTVDLSSGEEADADDGEPDNGESDEPQLLGPPALRVERDSVVVADPRLSFSRLASALGRAVPQTGIEIDDEFATGRMSMHVPRDVAAPLPSAAFGETVRPYLARFGRAYLAEVVAGTGVSTDTCRDALDSLVERGQAERVGPEEWRIVDEAGGRGPDT